MSDRMYLSLTKLFGVSEISDNIGGSDERSAWNPVNICLFCSREHIHQVKAVSSPSRSIALIIPARLSNLQRR